MQPQNCPHSVDKDNRLIEFIYDVQGQVLNGWCDLLWNQSPFLDALLYMICVTWVPSTWVPDAPSCCYIQGHP